MNIREIAQKDWQKNWAGRWSLLSCVYIGYQYTRQLKEVLGVSLEETLFVSEKGISSCYFLDEHKEHFGKTLAEQAKQDETQMAKWAQNLITVSDEVLASLKSLRQKPLTQENWEVFLQALYDYGVAHRIVKVVVDYLPQELLTKGLDALSEARVYAEPVYEETEHYMEYIAQLVADKEGCAPHHILALMRAQWEEYLAQGRLPAVAVMERQHEKMALYMRDGEWQYIDAPEEQQQIESALLGSQEQVRELKGQIAYKGIVQGRARVVLDPSLVTDFAEGSILVTGMTRPDYLWLVEKSAGFVTDAGGILSHAAITARELRKPCIIGTNTATKVLKDGDMVEVDAENGVVRKLS